MPSPGRPLETSTPLMTMLAVVKYVAMPPTIVPNDSGMSSREAGTPESSAT